MPGTPDKSLKGTVLIFMEETGCKSSICYVDDRNGDSRTETETTAELVLSLL
jgi:hypothetical protein